MLIHKGFHDPPRLAEAEENEEKAMEHYRRMWDEIRAFLEAMPGALEN